MHGSPRSSRPFLGTVLIFLGGGLASAPAEPTENLLHDRLIHTFDFDERGEGNMESIPKYWTAFLGPEFPRFATGSFDTSAGHDAPPSFLLEVQGRNVAYRYDGPDTLISPQSDYMIVGWLRYQGLAGCRAAMSAYYVDYHRLPMTETQRFSPLFGEEPSEQWQRVEVYLPAGPPEARTVGISVWLVQSEVWDVGPKLPRSIQTRDVGAKVWFDDLQVFRMPGLHVSGGGLGNVVEFAEGAALELTVTDASPQGLHAAMEAHDISGRQVLAADQPVGTADGREGLRLPCAALPPGLYRVHLRVSQSGQQIADQSFQFAKVAEPLVRHTTTARAFGVVIDAHDRADPPTEAAMLRALKVGAVKLPVWSGSAERPDLPDQPASTQQMLNEFLQNRVALTGVFVGPPSAVVREAGPYPRPLLGLLVEDPQQWQKYLVRVVAPYASVFGSWQIGPDGDKDFAADSRLLPAVAVVREQMRTLTTIPSITIPGNLTDEPSLPATSVEHVCLSVDEAVSPSSLASYLEHHRGPDHERLSLYLPPTRLPDTDRPARLRDYAKRLIHAHHAGIETAYVRQPWRTRPGVVGALTEPDEEFIILRTVVNLLGETRPADSLRLNDRAAALCFVRADRATLALWDDSAGPEGTRQALQLGNASRQIDLWGRATELAPTEDGRRWVTLSPNPVFIDHVDHGLIRFQAGIALVPADESVGQRTRRFNLHFANPYADAISVQGRVDAPAEWELSTKHFDTVIPAGRAVDHPVEIRFGPEEPAGRKEVELHVNLRADRDYKVILPLTLEVGSPEIEAWGLATIEGDRLVLRHRVKNRSGSQLNFRAFAVAPGRTRQTRLLTEFEPGEARTLEYRFKDAASLVGRTIRLQLRELNGSRLHNLDVVVEP